MAINIAIEIGSSYTTIFVENNNVVLREPSIVAFLDDAKKTIRAVGRHASALKGKTTEKINFVTPIEDGYITDPESASVMLSEFLKQIFPSKGKFLSKPIKAILSTPASLTVEERKTYEDVCLRAGISKVEMLDKVILSSVGASLPISDGGAIVVSIGGGCTEIALVSVYSIIAGCSVNIGGNMMDKAIVDYVIGKYGIKISRATAQKLKEQVGSLMSNCLLSYEVKGLDTESLTPSAITLCSYDVYEAISPYYKRIAEGIISIVNECPPALCESLHDRGVFVVGGGAKIHGLEKFLSKETNLNVKVCPDPEYSSIIGGGKLINDKDLLNQIFDAN